LEGERPIGWFSFFVSMLKKNLNQITQVKGATNYEKY